MKNSVGLFDGITLRFADFEKEQKILQIQEKLEHNRAAWDMNEKSGIGNAEKAEARKGFRAIEEKLLRELRELQELDL